MILSGTLISNLKKLGLSENEAKAYVCLVIKKQSSAREVHEFTDIPRAKVYEVLDGLVEKRFAQILKGTPIHYTATDPDELMRMLKETFESISAEIIQDFEEMEINIVDEADHESESTRIQYLRSEWTIRKKISELLDETNKNLIIFSRSPEILKRIESELVSIKKRVNVIILVDSKDGYEDISLPVTIYPENVRPLLKELEDSHLSVQKCFIISDVKKAIAIGEINSKLEAHYIVQPVIDYLYKTIYYFVSNADTIVLPPEFHEPEASAAKKTSGRKSCSKKVPSITITGPLCRKK
ncbi:TrmB family transcriptional regulator [Methanimicrococcus blatticola]|uniref:Transcriptional regulator n=1 Tax=Methanimicrococcus blatticola TaxID=91560 RepID=A0A484F5X6_9EURY|nr:helix-turn-helix domain-containing protein [Methanimicrococcus blatticola]MBZ3935695.1 hypothetical protein [Methanimicrococcus blatticola]MCC2508184.1 TrmB family transcriptional regulator [Methanimicrococcus blatticola]TDQ68740.1 transcriptional regulator [Methanimicrococcus blatticola]